MQQTAFHTWNKRNWCTCNCLMQFSNWYKFFFGWSAKKYRKCSFIVHVIDWISAAQMKLLPNKRCLHVWSLSTCSLETKRILWKFENKNHQVKKHRSAVEAWSLEFLFFLSVFRVLVRINLIVCVLMHLSRWSSSWLWIEEMSREREPMKADRVSRAEIQRIGLHFRQHFESCT